VRIGREGLPNPTPGQALASGRAAGSPASFRSQGSAKHTGAPVIRPVTVLTMAM